MIPPRPRDLTELTTREMHALRAPDPGFTPEVVVGVTVHGNDPALARCLNSIGAQRMDHARVGIILLVDQVTPSADLPAVPNTLLARTWLVTANCGSAARARNAVLDFAAASIPSCRWVARMDSDDRFATEVSLSAALDLACERHATFVVGGNRVCDRNGNELRLNPFDGRLLDPEELLALLNRMADGTATNELPSCNLLLDPRAGHRYPDGASAEDHWLVADLLINHGHCGAVQADPLYADYTLDGPTTQRAKQSDRHRGARVALAEAARTWLAVRAMPGRILGLGLEGIVREYAGSICKHFYRGNLTPEKAHWFNTTLSRSSILPRAYLEAVGEDQWVATYPREETTDVASLDTETVHRFLRGCLDERVVCANVKRPNFQLRANGELLYIDIGNPIMPMNVSYLRDSAARLYSIGVLGNSDAELLRRPADHSRPEIWHRLPGFAEFFAQVVTARVHDHWATAPVPRTQAAPRREDVSLLIKACAMDAPYLREQVVHIVDQLTHPIDFAERVLLIDAHAGPFLRQHTPGDLQTVLRIADELRKRAIVDRVLMAPNDEAICTAINLRWFGLSCPQSHSSDGVPIVPQLWGFEAMRTRYVLQCDVDVLIGRRDRTHDFLADMVSACLPDDVVCVAFNIAKDPQQQFEPYDAPPGEYKPEVRCGLLDLQRLLACRPLPNTLAGGSLTQPWYRALHAHQRTGGLRTVRGGDARTFYVHPLNDRKHDPTALARVRDLVAQGRVPEMQWLHWDLVGNHDDWQYARRSEPTVILARGRDTDPARLWRFADSLHMQTDQSFGVIAIDDAPLSNPPSLLADALRFLGDRLTLIRNHERRGAMANNILAIREICDNPDALVVVVDLDDALADRDAIAIVRSHADNGHDVILAAPFRPDVPTKIYRPDFHRPRRNFGGDVWIHLRAFRKHLFDRVPDSHLQLDSRWVTNCEDYAVMMSVVELAKSPAYIADFLYWHERTTGHAPDEKANRSLIVERLLAKAELPPGHGG